MRRSALALAGALAPLVSLAACPSLSQIGVASRVDATVDDSSRPPPAEGGPEARADAPSRDGAADAACTANVRTDPHNCGRCGHDCLGGGCTSGACDRIVLYSGFDTPTSIAVDGDSVFVTVQTSDPHGGYVFRCKTSDCMKTKTDLATRLNNPWFAVAHGGSLYWVNSGYTDEGGVVSESGNLMSCPETGCPASGPVAYLPDGGGVDGGGGATITGLAIDSTYLYWADLFGSSSASTGGIYRCARSDCPGTVGELVVGASFIPFDVAVDSNQLYWTDFGTNQVLRCSLPTCSGSPQIFANDQKEASGLALYAGHVYWTEWTDGGGVFGCPATGCGTAPTAIATGQPSPVFVVADESGIYWTNAGDGTIMHCPLTGCVQPVRIADALAAFWIALDAVSVYFTDSSVRGAVFRVAK